MKNMMRMTALLCALLLSLSAASAEGALEVLLSPATTQAFTGDPIPEADVTTILQAGLNTASAINQQPWYLVALTNSEIMAEISGGSGMPAGSFTPPADAAVPADEGASSGAPASDMNAGSSGAPAAATSSAAKAALGDSPLAILVYMNTATKSHDPSFDCGMACQSMVTAAMCLGYGAKVVSSPKMTLNGDKHDAFCEKLGVDPALEAVAVILIGRVDESIDGASGASVRDEMAAKVSFIN